MKHVGTTLGECVLARLEADLEDSSHFAARAVESTGDRRSIWEAYERKEVKYRDLATAFREHFGSHGWTVQVLPWVVVVRGVLHVARIRQAMAFLEGPIVHA